MAKAGPNNVTDKDQNIFVNDYETTRKNDKSAASSGLVQEIIMNNQPLRKGLQSSNEVSEGRTPHV